MDFKKSIEEIKYAAINSMIYYNYYHKKIDDNLVYVESRNGKDFTGNIFRIVEELSTGKYGDLRIVVYAKKDIHPRISELMKNYSLKIDEIVSDRTKATMIMHKSRYIITDSVLFHKFVKRPGQTVINTWHGTPLVSLGIENRTEKFNIASVQQVFFSSDYLLFSSEYARDKILSSYMMEKIFPGKVLIGGQPQNSIFYKDNSDDLKRKLNLENKEIFAYVPSFKGRKLFKHEKDRVRVITKNLKEIDEGLTDNQVLLVKLHDSNKNQINLTQFKHIMEFPASFETYDVLNMADALIADYTEVIFDYANANKKIILFNYDYERFLEYYGMYVSLDELPFPKADNVKNLIRQLNSPKCYDDADFIEKYCRFDSENAAEDICRHIFLNEKILKEEQITSANRNTLIFAGGLRNNGLTSSLLNLLSELDYDSHDYFLSYRSWSNYIRKYYSEVFSSIPNEIDLAPLRTPINMTLKEMFQYHRYLNSKNNGEPSDSIKQLFKRELKRAYVDFRFDNVIQFTGFGENEILMLSQSESNKIIWAHGNMIKEIENGKQNEGLLRYAYNTYDTVCVVSEESIRHTSKISGRKDNIKMIHNINNYKKIIANSKKEIEFNEDTIMMCNNPGGIKGVLESPGKKFVTIGRFSVEKNHEMLINVFNEFCHKYPDTQLIIIGGYGPLYFQTRRIAEKSDFAHNITIIRTVFNPMSILSKCDLFILPSKYEGWPMTIMEADTLKIPIIASDIQATQWLKEYGTYLFKNNFDGLLNAMYDYMDGKVKMGIGLDYEDYNKNVLNDFLELIDN